MSRWQCVASLFTCEPGFSAGCIVAFFYWMESNGRCDEWPALLLQLKCVAPTFTYSILQDIKLVVFSITFHVIASAAILSFTCNEVVLWYIESNFQNRKYTSSAVISPLTHIDGDIWDDSLTISEEYLTEFVYS